MEGDLWRFVQGGPKKMYHFYKQKLEALRIQKLLFCWASKFDSLEYSWVLLAVKFRHHTRHVQNQIFIGGYWYVIYTRSWFRSCMGLRLRSRLGNFGKISRDFGKYSSRPGFSVYNLGKISEIWSRLIFFVYCSLNLNTVIVLLPGKRPRSRNSRSNRDPGLDLRHRDGHVWITGH